MYTECMSEKKKFPPRMSLPLSAEERAFIIDLKYALEKQDRHLKNFVLEAMLEKNRKEKLTDDSGLRAHLAQEDKKK